MKKDLSQTIEIPEGVEANIDGSSITVKGSKGENKRTFNVTNLSFEKKGNKIVVGNKKATKKDKRMMNTIAAHVKNMIKGVQEKFEYKLKVCFSHFPITVELKGNEGIIKNFLGEKTPRKMKIKEGAEVKVDKDIITITSTDKEIAGKVAADFERATWIRMRDRRIFQDGIFITSKAGEDI
ncbi:MAG: 50S ribosomal protein L6 [Nanoarchaeota archaeon]|nr:50S ribosomal protein L6 [Nanoarchaeota archaeon]